MENGAAKATRHLQGVSQPVRRPIPGKAGALMGTFRRLPGEPSAEKGSNQEETSPTTVFN